MPHWRSLIEKDHLGSWDLVGKDNKPRDYTLKIVKVDSVALKTRETPRGRRKCVITFERAEKKFVANTTNCETIESMYGSDTDGWIGKLITLYQTDVKNPKKSKPGQPPTVKGIRVRPRPPTGQAEPIASQPVDPAIRGAQDSAFEPEPGDRGDDPDGY